MAEDWDFYVATVDDHPASLFVDLGQIEQAPDVDRSWLLRVALPLRNPRGDGLSDPEETDVLYAIEDRLFAELGKGLRARYVGRVTTQGRREHFYYATSADGFEEAATRALAEYPLYAASCRAAHDPDWTTYSNVLFPGDLEMQSIQTRRVVLQLSEHGDDLSQPREIDHWVLFPSEEARDHFLIQVAGNRFRAVSSLSDDPSDKFRYVVRLTRTDRVELETIDGLVTDLFLRAQSCEGEYDGWESPVVSGG